MGVFCARGGSPSMSSVGLLGSSWRMARSAFPRPVLGRVGWRGAMIGHMGSAAGSDAVAGGVAGPGAGGIVSRPRLFERLGASARVTVVSAPPGSGKTVLLRSWIGQARRAGSAAVLAVGARRAAPDGPGAGAGAAADGGAGPGRVGDRRAAAERPGAAGGPDLSRDRRPARVGPRRSAAAAGAADDAGARGAAVRARHPA